MKLYHGSLVPVEEPRILRREQGRDFGFAFYVTDIQEQAERWALRRKRAAFRLNNLSAQAIVSIYDFDKETAQKELAVLEFNTDSMDWLELVVACRSIPSFSHENDIVIGKIANDNVGETIAYVIAGVMRKEDALSRLQFQKINSQLAFCTERALHYLKYVSSYIVEKSHD